MSKVHLITMPRLNRAVAKVQNELDRHGLWDEAMSDIDVYLVPLGYAYGWQWYGGSGNINVPALSWGKLTDWWQGKYTSLADIVRHEYGHAFADTHRGQMRSKAFRQAFGAAHDNDSSWKFEIEVFVSKYAADRPMEDFAETFMFVLRHAGKLPAKFDTPSIRAKWRFVKSLGRV